MKIQSLSVVVPNKTCINNCRFCVSRMHENNYVNRMDVNDPLFDLNIRDYIKRLEFARDNGCNTVMLTGTSEPQQNKVFLTHFGLFMSILKNPFKIIEMQTTGVLLDMNYLRFLRNFVGVNTISLSLSSLSNEKNGEYNSTPEAHRFVISTFCAAIKKLGFTLRLSLNMTDEFDGLQPEHLFKALQRLGADQVIFRKLYATQKKSAQRDWIIEHGAKDETLRAIFRYIRDNGRALEELEFGETRYSVDGLSTVMDYDCMNSVAKKDLKYLILREDCRLYSKWDDAASLIF